jgi:GAF domain
MRITEIIKILGNKCTRHLLRHWDEYIPNQASLRVLPLSKGAAHPSASAKFERENYTDADVNFLSRMYYFWRQGFTAAGAAAKAQSAWFGNPAADVVTTNLAQTASELLLPGPSSLLFALLRGDPIPPSPAIKRGEGLDRVARAGSAALDAETFSFFMVDREESDDLVLVADAKGETEPIQLGFRIRKYKQGSGYTTTVATSRRPSNEVGQHLSEGDQAPTHLRSARRSFLAVPLVDRKGNLLGVMKAENKRPVVEDMTFGVFDESDERVIATLSAATVPIVELHRILGHGLDIVNCLSHTQTFVESASLLLEAALRIVGADRGEISRWDEDEGLVFEIVVGDTTIERGQVLPTNRPSITTNAYWNRVPRCVRDVTDSKDKNEYFKCNEDTRSEIAVPIIQGEQAVGVLNVESNKKGGEGGLDEGDVPVLQALARLASIALQAAELRNSAVHAISEQELRLVFHNCLQRARQKFDRAILYTVDYRAAELRRRLPVPEVKGEFSALKLTEKSLAREVFLKKDLVFSPTPEKDDRVWWDGLSILGIKGSLGGFPILVGATVVSVIMMWHSSGARMGKEEGEEVIRDCMKGIAPGLRIYNEYGVLHA